MNKLILAAALAATIAPALPASADPPSWAQNDGRDGHRGDHRDRRDDRRAEHQDRRDAHRFAQQDNRDEWRTYRRYDYNRPDPRYGTGYDAARYYRDDRAYGERRLTRYDRIYRGNDGRYYCRRSDGTTGLIVGALAGGMLGNTLANGRSTTLITILGAGSGGLIGRSIDRGSARCR